MDSLGKVQEPNTFSNIVSCLEDIENEHVGEELQRLSLIKKLPDLIKEDERSCREKIFPKLQQTIAPSSLELQREASIVFIEILQHELVSVQTFARFFLFPILFGIDRKDEASEIWVETLLTALDYLTEDVIVHDVLPLALFKARLSQTSRNRIIASKLLGKLSLKFDSQKVIKDIYPLVLSLCQDDDDQIRICICSQLSLVARGLPTDMVRSSLIPVLVELGQDAVLSVRCEAIQTVVDIIPYLPPEELKQTVIPLIRKICAHAATYQDESLNIIARQFGSICFGLEGSLSLEDKKWLFTYFNDIVHIGVLRTSQKEYSTLASSDEARFIDVRHQCSYNLPAIASLVVSANNRDLLESYANIVCELSSDTYAQIRKTVGAGLHEVVRVLGCNSVLIKNVIITLLCDTKLEVLSGILSNFALTIAHLVEAGVLGVTEDSFATEVGKSLLHCDALVHSKHYNWRLVVSFLNEMKCLVKFQTSDFIYTHFVNQMFVNMQKSVPTPCREAASFTLLVFLRYNLRSTQRQEILSRLYNDYCHSRDFYQRKLFMKICACARDVFSKSYYKQHFFTYVLSAANDSVSNIRMLLALQMPYLKSMLETPADNKLIEQFEQVMKTFLENEKDKDVLEALNKSKSEIENIQFDEIEDRRRYEEELRLIKIKADLGPGAGIAFKYDKKKNKEKTRRLKSPPPLNNKTSKINELENSFVRNNYGSGKWYDVSTNSTKAKVNTFTDPRRNSLMSNKSLTTNMCNNMVYTLKTTLHGCDNYQDTNCDYRNSCTCYLPFDYNNKTQSDVNENLNLRALNIDSNNVNTMKNKFDMEEEKRKANNSLTKYKLTQNCKYNMEISWLNLETDLKNELYTLVTNKNRKLIPGDKYFNEKARFLADFKNFKNSDNPSFKFKLCDTKINSIDSKYKNKSVYEDSNKSYSRPTPRLFEEKLNFFEEKCRNNYLEDAKSNSDYTDCSCFDLSKPVSETGTNTNVHVQSNSRNVNKNFTNTNYNACSTNNTNPQQYVNMRTHDKKFNFSENFEQDFYRDAGIKMPDMIARQRNNMKLVNTNIPVYDWKKDIGYDNNRRYNPDDKIKRRTWFGDNILNEKQYCNTFPNDRIVSWKDKRSSISLDYIFKDVNLSNLLLQTNDVCDKVANNLSIGQRSKSFVLPSTSISCETTEPNSEGQVQGAIPKYNPDRINNEDEEKIDKKERNVKNKARVKNGVSKTKIPVGRISSQSSPSSSRSSSPASSVKDEVITKEKNKIIVDTKDKLKTARNVVNNRNKSVQNGQKQTSTTGNQTKSARNSMIITATNMNKNINRRSLDSSKINTCDNLNKDVNISGKVVDKKITQKVSSRNGEKIESDSSLVSGTSTSSRLPIRKKKALK